MIYRRENHTESCCGKGVKPSPVMLASYTRVQVQAPAAMLLVQFLANAAKAAEEDPRVCVPATYMGDLGGIPGY